MSSTPPDERLGKPARPDRTVSSPPPGHGEHHTPHRWLVLTVIGLAQLMVVLDATIVNIALPSAQRALHFNNDGRQWIITAYALAFGSLLLLGGRLADFFGRRLTFITGLIGFAAASALGGAAHSFTLLVLARTLQGMFGALLAPSALSLLTTTFTDPSERSKAFGIFGAIAGSGGAIGLLLGGVLTEHLSWRWTLYVNVLIAVVAVIGALVFLHRQPRVARPRLDLLGTLLAGAGVFCLVFGFSRADTRSWGDVTCWAFLVACPILLGLFVLREHKARHALLPLRIVADRNRGASFLSVFLAGSGMFGVFLFLTYYLQTTLHYSPVKTGLAFLPMIVALTVVAQIAINLLIPRIGPKPVVPFGMLLAAGGLAWLTRLGLHSTYGEHVLPPLLLMGIGLGMVFPPSISLATLGIRARDQGVASATVNTMQQVGGSVGTALLNTQAADAATRFARSHAHSASLPARAALHSYSTAFWWAAGFFVFGLLVTVFLFRSGRPAQLVPGGAVPEESHDVNAGEAQDEQPPRAPGPAESTHRLDPGDGHPAPDSPGAGDTQPFPAVGGATQAGGLVTGHPQGPPHGSPTAEEGAAAFGAGGYGSGTDVRGQVLTDDGTPVSEAAVTLIDASGRQLGRATASAEGHYTLRTPARGTYVLVGSAPGHRPQVATLAVDGPAQHDIVLEAAGGLLGTVHAGGAPVADALVVATDERGEVALSTSTDSGGSYQLAALAPGHYTLTVTASGHQPTAEPVTVDDAAPTRHDAELVRAATVRGTVRTRTGRPLPDARVTLLDLSGNVVGQQVTGEDGVYVFTDLAPGDYTVVASGYPPVTSPLSVVGAGGDGYDFTLSHEDRPQP